MSILLEGRSNERATVQRCLVGKVRENRLEVGLNGGIDPEKIDY